MYAPVKLVVGFIDNLQQLVWFAWPSVDEIKLPIVRVPAAAVNARRNETGNPKPRCTFRSGPDVEMVESLIGQTAV